MALGWPSETCSPSEVRAPVRLRRRRHRPRRVPLMGLPALQSLWSEPVSGHRVPDPAFTSASRLVFAVFLGSSLVFRSSRALRLPFGVLRCRPALPRSGRPADAAVVGGIDPGHGSGRLPWGFCPIRGVSRSRRLAGSQVRDISVLVVSHDLDGFSPRSTSRACFIPLPRAGFALQGVSPTESRAGSRPPLPPSRFHLVRCLHGAALRCSCSRPCSVRRSVARDRDSSSGRGPIPS